MATKASQFTEEQLQRIERVVARTYRGIHHAPYWRRREERGFCIAVSVPAMISTYDYDELTRLVLAAHDEAVRVEICPGGPGMLRLFLSPRLRESDSSVTRHPTIEQAVEQFRSTR